MKHGLGELIEVTATHDENSGIREAHLDSLEVVGEIRACLHRVESDLLGLCVIEVKLPRVLLHDVDLKVRVLLRDLGHRSCLDHLLSGKGRDAD